ncbi:hypothetical protein VKS41_006433 [Umbelopsis sp. WA50703]
MLTVAKSVGVPLTIDNFQTIVDKTPFLANLRSSGKYVMEDLHAVGDHAENLAEVPDLTDGQEIIRPLSNPIKPSGHLTILKGNLVPEKYENLLYKKYHPAQDAVAKITGKEGLAFKGRARVFNDEDIIFEALEQLISGTWGLW